MSPYYGPAGESASEIALERLFLASNLVAGTGFGIQFGLYFSCFLYLWRRRKQNRSALFLLAYITTLFSLEFLFVVVQGEAVQMIYIDNRNYPGGPFAFYLAMQNAPANVMFYAALLVLTFPFGYPRGGLCSFRIMHLIFVSFGAAGSSGQQMAADSSHILLLTSFRHNQLWEYYGQSKSPNQGEVLFAKLPLAYGTAYYAISLGVNIIITIFIISRLLLYRRRLLKSVPYAHAGHYISMMTIAIESRRALLAIRGTVWLVAASAAQQIAGYLIMYRLADGRAWRADTLRDSSIVLSGLQFGSVGGDDVSPAPLRQHLDATVIRGGDTR
ncbi:hypothetical protein B0H14DRAFT_3858896 [Mycena olivaceomarginata]|nr:hypothetical protein B0H14DRAFT_3858896 [Mycena olivaceomarginata]